MLELRHGDPVLLAGNNYQPFPQTADSLGMRFASQEHPQVTAFLFELQCQQVPRASSPLNASAIASLNSLTENILHSVLQTEPTERTNAS